MSDPTNILQAPDTVKLQTKSPSTPEEIERERIRLMKEQEKHYKRLFRELAKTIKAEGVADRKEQRRQERLEREQRVELRRIKKALTRERLSGATSLAAATRTLLGNRPEASTGGQIRTADGRTSFHFEFTTVSKNAACRHSAVAHLHYIARGSAVAKLVFTDDPQAQEAARLMGYAARGEAVARGPVSEGTNPFEPEERREGAMVFGTIGKTRKEQEAYWHSVAASERTPTRNRFLTAVPITDALKVAEVVNRYRFASLYAEWDSEAQAFALVPPDNIDKKVLATLERRLKEDLNAKFIRSRGGRVQHRIIAGLPHELSPAAMMCLCDEFTAVLRADGLNYFGAIHKPDGDNNPLNWHLHLAFHDRPAKRVEIDGRSMWDFEYVKRDVRNARNLHPLRQEKCRWLNDKATPAKLRKTWCDLANKYLAEAGVEKRWFSERYDQVGIGVKALKRLPQKVYAMEMRGIQTTAGRERIRQEQAQSRDRRKALQETGVPKARIDEQEQIAIKSTDQAARLLTRRAALKREIQKRERLLQSNSARDAEKLRTRLARDREALKIVNAMLAEIDGGAKPAGRAIRGPFSGARVQAAFAPRDGLAATWSEKRVAFAPTAAEIAGREHLYRDHPEGEMERNKRRTGENIADRQLARLQNRFATSTDDSLRMAVGSMKEQARIKLNAPDAQLIRIHEADSAKLMATANAREIEILAAVTGLRPAELRNPETRRAAIAKHVETLYRAEQATATLVKEGLTLDTFEPSPLEETAPQAPIVPSAPSIASTASVQTVASSPTVAATPSVSSETPPRPIPKYNQFRQRVFQDWTNAFLSFKTNPDREKQYDRLFVEDTIRRALNLIDSGEPVIALRTGLEQNVINAKRLDPEAKRALYESAAFEAIKRDPDQRVRMERLAIAGEIVNRSKKVENENGTFYRVQKDLAFALAEPVYAPYVGDEITRYAYGDYSQETFDKTPQRDYRVSKAEAAQYDAQQSAIYVDIPDNVFRERLDNLRNTIIDLPNDNDAGVALMREADKRFNAYLDTDDMSMLTEAPGVTLGVIPVGPPGEERAINMMRARQNLPPVKIADSVAKDARAAFLAPEPDGSTLQGPDDLREWAAKKFASRPEAGLLYTSETARAKALAPQSSFSRTLAPFDLQAAYRALGVRIATGTPTRATLPYSPSTPKLNPIKPCGPTQ